MAQQKKRQDEGWEARQAELRRYTKSGEVKVPNLGHLKKENTTSEKYQESIHKDPPKDPLDETNEYFTSFSGKRVRYVDEDL